MVFERTPVESMMDAIGFFKNKRSASYKNKKLLWEAVMESQELIDYKKSIKQKEKKKVIPPSI